MLLKFYKLLISNLYVCILGMSKSSKHSFRKLEIEYIDENCFFLFETFTHTK